MLDQLSSVLPLHGRHSHAVEDADAVDRVPELPSVFLVFLSTVINRLWLLQLLA